MKKIFTLIFILACVSAWGQNISMVCVDPYGMPAPNKMMTELMKDYITRSNHPEYLEMVNTQFWNAAFIDAVIYITFEPRNLAKGRKTASRYKATFSWALSELYALKLMNEKGESLTYDDVEKAKILKRCLNKFINHAGRVYEKYQKSLYENKIADEQTYYEQTHQKEIRTEIAQYLDF